MYLYKYKNIINYIVLNALPPLLNYYLGKNQELELSHVWVPVPWQ